MQGQRKTVASPLRSTIAIAVLALLAAASLAYWGYSAYQKRELQGVVVALVADATSRVRETLQLPQSGAEDLETLEGHFKALTAATQRLSGLDTWRDPPLSDGAEQYLGEVQALLRRQIAVRRGRDAVLADVSALAEHLLATRGRSSNWVGEAIARKQRLERDIFDYRLAAGGLEKSLKALPDARQRLAPLVAPMPLLEDRLLSDARARLSEATKQIEQRVAVAGELPSPR